MLQKRPVGGKRFQVTFTMPTIEGVTTLHLCGEFNDWSPTANPMRRQPDGSWSATLTLEGGKSYMFRYHDDHGGWHNDWAADAYVPNQLGSENSVLDLAALQMTSSTREEQPVDRKRRSGPAEKQEGRRPGQGRQGGSNPGSGRQPRRRG